MRDPYEGPLSDMEFQALRQKITDAFENDALTLQDLVLVELFISTGRRPVQLADLKISDLVEGSSDDGLKSFLLSIPRRKQIGGTWRESHKPFALRPEIGSAVSELCRYNRQQLRRIVGSLEENLERELPLFPDWESVRELGLLGEDQLRGAFTTQAIRRSSESISQRVKTAIGSLNVPSERTGEGLHVFPYRLRRTLANRAAREGLGDLVIAELLDHSDTQNVKVYTENVPENVEAIDKAMAQQLAPLSQAFAGVLVRDAEEAVRGDDPASRVRSQDGAVGSCGNYSFCGALAPIACYTCQHFQPWLDGPHEEVLEGLWAERSRIQEVTGDETMAAVNDRTIVAVTEVVQRCRDRLEERSRGSGSEE
jgi:integrase